MNAPLITFAGALVLVFAVACASRDEGSGAATALESDLSQFPTPTRSRAELQPSAQPATTEVQPSQIDGQTAEVPSMSQEEVEQLRQRLQSGELSGEEARQPSSGFRNSSAAGSAEAPAPRS